MPRAMIQRGPTLAGLVEDLSASIVAVLALLSAAWHVGRWLYDQRQKLDMKLASMQAKLDELCAELDREEVQPCRGVRRARVLAAEVTNDLASAKKITSTRAVSGSSKRAEQGEWGE